MNLLEFSVYFLLFIASANSLAIEDCMVSDWKEWGLCHGAEQRSENAHVPFSFSMPASEQPDKGRAMMKVAMADKIKFSENRHQCQQDNTCPEFNPVPSMTEETKCINGMAGEYPCRNVDLLSHISIEDLGYSKELQSKYRDWNPRGNDIWGWTDPQTGKEYAIIGLSGGSSFVDVSDATKPKVLAFLPTHTGPSIWRDMKVVYNTAYIVSEARDHGLQVFDLLRLRDMTEFSVVEPDTHYDLFGNAHNIVSNVETGYVYVVGATDRKFKYSCRGGLHFINVRDRLEPAYAGCFPDDGYVHDAECVIYRGPDTRYQGQEICFCYNEDTLTLVDVTEKHAPVLLSKRGYSHAMYTHQGWLTEDQSTILLDDELDEAYDVSPDADKLGHTITYLWDVSDLLNPVLKNYYISTEVAIDHNQYILGDFTYQSNYGAGLRILHIDQDKYDLKEVAYFDCLPTAAKSAEFEGTWSNYPYFKSGNIIVSSIEYGLFVVRPDYEAMELAAKPNMSYMEQMRERSIDYAKAGAVCPGLVESRVCGVVAQNEDSPSQ